MLPIFDPSKRNDMKYYTAKYYLRNSDKTNKGNYRGCEGFTAINEQDAETRAKNYNPKYDVVVEEITQDLYNFLYQF